MFVSNDVLEKNVYFILIVISMYGVCYWCLFIYVCLPWESV